MCSELKKNAAQKFVDIGFQNPMNYKEAKSVFKNIWDKVYILQKKTRTRL